MERIKANPLMYFVGLIVSIGILIISYNTYRLDELVKSMHDVDRSLSSLSQKVEDGKVARIDAAKRNDDEHAAIQTSLRAIASEISLLQQRTLKIEQKVGL